MKLNWFEIVNALAVLILSVVLAWGKVREKRLSREMNLEDNPKRCDRHEKTLDELNHRIGNIEGDVKAIKVKIGLNP